MADDKDVLGILTPPEQPIKQAPSNDPLGILVEKKNSSPVVANTGKPSKIGGLQDLNSLTSTPQSISNAPIIDKTVRKQADRQQQSANRQLQEQRLANPFAGNEHDFDGIKADIQRQHEQQLARTQKALDYQSVLTSMKNNRNEKGGVRDATIVAPAIVEGGERMQNEEANAEKVKNEFEAPYRKQGFRGAVKLGLKYATSKAAEGTADLANGILSAAGTAAKGLMPYRIGLREPTRH
jgi:hypothetical protein